MVTKIIVTQNDKSREVFVEVQKDERMGGATYPVGRVPLWDGLDPALLAGCVEQFARQLCEDLQD